MEVFPGPGLIELLAMFSPLGIFFSPIGGPLLPVFLLARLIY